MLKHVLIGLAALIAVILIVVALQPGEFRVTRSATIDAPAPVVFEQVNNLQNWNAWSPWAKLDPNAKNSFEGPPAGVGACLAWTGNNQVGEGRMTVTESKPNEVVLMRLEFFKPFSATNATEFTFMPEGNQTEVTWSMSGKNNFIGKAMGLFMDCDKMVGSQFEQGFANLKRVVAAMPQ